MSLLNVHSKRCLSTAILNAVENLRDDPSTGSVAFSEAAESGQLVSIAKSYLADGLLTCSCRVGVLTVVKRHLESGDISRAQSYATAELQCGTISPEDYAEIAREVRTLPAACIHPGLFAPYDFEPGSTSTCHACGVEVDNYDL